jgi:hypothetical protein
MSTEGPPLGETEAHDEANLLRAKLREIVNRDPTPEDYDNALRAVNELKRLAENEPEFERIFLRMIQVANKYLHIGIDRLMSLLAPEIEEDPANISTKDWHTHMFDDASSRLKNLKDEAERLNKV